MNSLFLLDPALFSDRDLLLLSGCLPDRILSYCSSFSSPEARKQEVLSWSLVHGILRTKAGLDSSEIIRIHGKPAVRDAPIHFSLSHTESLCGMLISDRECGLDLERIRMHSRRAIQKACSASEQRQVSSSAFPGKEFTEIWVRREARAKLENRPLYELLGQEPDGEFLFVECRFRNVQICVCLPDSEKNLQMTFLDRESLFELLPPSTEAGDFPEFSAILEAEKEVEG